MNLYAIARRSVFSNALSLGEASFTLASRSVVLHKIGWTAGRSLFDFDQWEARLQPCIFKNIIFKAGALIRQWTDKFSTGRRLEPYDQRAAVMYQIWR